MAKKEWYSVVIKFLPSSGKKDVKLINIDYEHIVAMRTQVFFHGFWLDFRKTPEGEDLVNGADIEIIPPFDISQILIYKQEKFFQK